MGQKWRNFTTGALVCLGTLQSDPTTTASSAKLTTNASAIDSINIIAEVPSLLYIAP